MMEMREVLITGRSDLPDQEFKLERLRCAEFEHIEDDYYSDEVETPMGFSNFEFVKIKMHESYAINCYGTVLRLGGLNGIGGIMSPRETGRGLRYRSITLNGKHYYIHRLVYETFMEKIPEGLVINHLDLNPSNNYIGNLEAITQKENVLHYNCNKSTK